MQTSPVNDSRLTTADSTMQSPASKRHCDGLQTMDRLQSTSLHSLPTEIIHEIAEWLRATKKPLAHDCQCTRQELRNVNRSSTFDLSTAPATEWSDFSWAFSCIAKRYRDVVFHGNKTRKFSFGYATCCMGRIFGIPEKIRASAT
jgi:hypothetical protein